MRLVYSGWEKSVGGQGGLGCQREVAGSAAAALVCLFPPRRAFRNVSARLQTSGFFADWDEFHERAAVAAPDQHR